MRYGSVCSGIEAASVAWEPLGWQPAWFAEVEAFPSAVLAHHWPGVRNLGDMARIAADVLRGTVEAPDVLVGGTPCQAFSVAGMRKGLEDDRGQLTIKYVELLNAIDTVWIRAGKEPATCVWENVPGVLSDRGNAFGCFLGALAGESCALEPAGGRWANAGCVYGPQRTIAWRVLDAQHFGLAQRRRRVFLVASARAGLDPVAVLFEREGVRRDSPPRREAWEGAPATFESGVDLRNGCLTGQITQTVQAEAKPPSPAGVPHLLAVHGTQDPDVLVEPGHPLGRNYGQENIVCFAENSRQELRESHLVGALSTEGGKPGQGYAAIRDGLQVRRLTPEECEKLQGFKPGHTRIPWRNKGPEDCPDGPRYKAIGNSKAVPVVRWIGQRLQGVLDA